MFVSKRAYPIISTRTTGPNLKNPSIGCAEENFLRYRISKTNKLHTISSVLLPAALTLLVIKSSSDT